MAEEDRSAALQAEVADAFAHRRPLVVVGGGTKSFYGRAHDAASAHRLAVHEHRGILSYEPTELVLTARAGTPLEDIEAALAERGQHLPFEPPHYRGTGDAPGGGRATIGGAIASGLGGPRRAYAGAPRDFLLGARMLNGRGDDLRFGGEVMKNVAGYDVSRLLAGSMGTLGVLLEVSLKVLPRPPVELTLTWRLGAGEALERMRTWARAPLPISGTYHDGEHLLVRLSGSGAGVEAARASLGGTLPGADDPWAAIRDQHAPFFTAPAGEHALWRLALPDGVPALPGAHALEWGGTLRWRHGNDDPETIRALAARHGGHATLFRGGDRSGEVFHPLSAGIAALHRRLKRAFDPASILNPGRLYSDL